MKHPALSLTSILHLLCLFAGPALLAEAADPLPYRDVTFVSTLDGTTQRYVLVEPPERKTDDVLIALHGHGSDRWVYVLTDIEECRAVRELAAERGMLFVAPDYRAPTSWMGPAAEADMVQIIAELKREHGVKRVFLCGGSMGGTGALTFAVKHPELLDGVASMNGTANLWEYGNFLDAIAESYGGTKEAVPDEYRGRSAEFYPWRLTMPVAICAGALDGLVPADSVVRLASALQELDRKVLLLYREEGGHSTTYADARESVEFILDEAAPTGGATTAPSPQDFCLRDVSFTAALDGTTQQYIIIEPALRKSPDVLIALHGHGSNRWQFATYQLDEARAARDVALARGMLYVSPDYRAGTSWMGPAAEADMVQIIEELKQKEQVRKVFLCGASMGGTGALIFAARQPDLIDGVASFNGAANMVEYDQFQEAIQESYGGTKEEVPDEYHGRSAEFFPERFTMPIGITAGALDPLVPSASVVRLGKALEEMGGKVLLLHREEGSHATTYEDAREALEFMIKEAGGSE